MRKSISKAKLLKIIEGSLQGKYSLARKKEILNKFIDTRKEG